MRTASISRYLVVAGPVLFAGVIFTLAVTEQAPIRSLVNVSAIWSAIAGWFFVVRFGATKWFATSLGRTFMMLMFVVAVTFTYLITRQWWGEYFGFAWSALIIYTSTGLVTTRLGVLLMESAREKVPTVGRVVHYQSYGTPNGEYTSVARAAIITEVNADGTVGLFIMNPEGIFLNRSIIFSEEPKPGHWSWPPLV